MTNPNSLSVGSTNLVQLQDLRDNLNNYPQNATVSVTIFDSTGAALAGATNLALAWIAATGGINGHYEVAVPNTVALVSQAIYTVTVTATVGANVRKFPTLCVAA